MVGDLAIGVGIADVVLGLSFFPSGIVVVVAVVDPLADAVLDEAPMVAFVSDDGICLVVG